MPKVLREASRLWPLPEADESLPAPTPVSTLHLQADLSFLAGGPTLQQCNIELDVGIPNAGRFDLTLAKNTLICAGAQHGSVCKMWQRGCALALQLC